VARPDFVVIGHVVRDLLPEGWRLGGTAVYAAVQAHRLGWTTGIVTSAGREIDFERELSGIEMAVKPSMRTTSFKNVYDGAQRSQTVPEQADSLSMAEIPVGWRSPSVMLLGPVCGELAPATASDVSPSLLAVSAQGWLRSLNGERRVTKLAWQGSSFWRGAQALFVSDEDLAGADGTSLDLWAADVPTVAVTEERRGARIHSNGQWQRIDSFPANEVDPTGAGDVFATAFLLRYHETGMDVTEASRFASSAAACAIESHGIAGIADRATIDARLAAHPEITLR
jgi:sugar/nucleoside kinase (ribokinase family)